MHLPDLQHKFNQTAGCKAIRKLIHLVTESCLIPSITKNNEHTKEGTRPFLVKRIISGNSITMSVVCGHHPIIQITKSILAAISGVRVALVRQQRTIAADGPIVMVGRDIGTVVLPGSPLKIYLTASARERAIRRHRDFVAEGTEVDLEDILRSIEQRDHLDSSRENSPLKPADDARVVDTDELSLEQVVDLLIELAEEVI